MKGLEKAWADGRRAVVFHKYAAIHRVSTFSCVLMVSIVNVVALVASSRACKGAAQSVCTSGWMTAQKKQSGRKQSIIKQKVYEKASVDWVRKHSLRRVFSHCKAESTHYGDRRSSTLNARCH